MTAQIIIQIILYGISLSMDAFAVSVSYALTYTGINRKRIFLIALTFGVFQAIMPLISYWLIEGIGQMVGVEKSADVGHILSLVVTWLAFALLLFIGSKMILEGSKRLKQSSEEKVEKVFSYKELLMFGVATAIDALAVGVSLHSGTLSNNVTVWLHVSIIMVITFTLSLIGVILGSSIVKLLKGKQDITSIIGGIILLLLAIWVVVAHYLGI